jgi:PAS domain S-box-containing protein
MPGDARPEPASAGARRRRPGAKPGGAGAAALRALVESSDDGMILADGLGHILYANAAAERVLGHRPGELVGRVGFDLCRPEHLAAAQEGFGRCLAHPGEPVALTVDVAPPTGGFRTLAATLVNRLHVPGVGAVVVHFRDAASGTSGHAEDTGEYRALFESVPIGLGVADLDGTLLTFNDAMLAPGGYTRDDIQRLGNVSLLYCHAADRERILRIGRERGFVWREEVQFRRKDGSCYDTLLSLSPVQFRGHPCWCAAVEDITDRKLADAKRRELEAQLRQAQKMEAVGRMTGGIAHDFNNLLLVIQANAELVANALGAEAGEARRDLTELRAAAERGAAMIRRLLGFSRTADLNIRPIDLGELVTGLHVMLRHVLPADIALEMSTAEDSTALCDPGAVEQMLLNLATNARDAMPAGGTVRIEVSPAVVGPDVTARTSWLAPGEFVRLSVRDTGVGMDDGIRARVLEPFFTTKPPGIGTGLGLSMVYGLVKQQGGFIDLVSQPGQGTTVHLYFPKAAEKPEPRRPVPASVTPRGGSATILLLEDDESLQRTMRRILEHLGYHVLVAGDGTEGLALFLARQSEIDLVISDMIMPGLTGTQVYEAISRYRPAVRFLLSSGYQERPEGTHEPPPGVQVIAKPWTIDELARTVTEALSG